MKKLFILLVLVGCGDNVEVSQPRYDVINESCRADARPDGNFIVCPDGSEFQVEDGTNGINGTFTGTLEIVTLCPNISVAFPEVLLRLEGTYMAFLSESNWKKQRLVVLQENVTYTSSDGRNVQFMISSAEIQYFTGGCE